MRLSVIILLETHSQNLTRVKKTLHLYRRAILQDSPLSAITVAWQVWWAAGVDMALHASTKVGWGSGFQDV